MMRAVAVLTLIRVVDFDEWKRAREEATEAPLTWEQAAELFREAIIDDTDYFCGAPDLEKEAVVHLLEIK